MLTHASSEPAFASLNRYQRKIVRRLPRGKFLLMLLPHFRRQAQAGEGIILYNAEQICSEKTIDWEEEVVVVSLYVTHKGSFEDFENSCPNLSGIVYSKLLRFVKVLVLKDCWTC